jgi:hypothetical protein
LIGKTATHETDLLIAAGCRGDVVEADVEGSGALRNEVVGSTNR